MYEYLYQNKKTTSSLIVTAENEKESLKIVSIIVKNVEDWQLLEKMAA